MKKVSRLPLRKLKLRVKYLPSVNTASIQSQDYVLRTARVSGRRERWKEEEIIGGVEGRQS